MSLQPGTFDLPSAIKELAEVERVSVCLPDFEGDPPGSVGTQSMEVPFAALRKPSCEVLSGHYHRTIWYHPQKGKPCNEGWQPEPDVEKASARIHAAYPHICHDKTPEQEIRAAQAWVKEQHGRCTSDRSNHYLGAHCSNPHT